jgi:hypothetical protein
VSEFVDMVCIGGANDGRRMRVALNNRAAYLQLVVPNNMKAILHEKYPGRQSVTYEVYALSFINGVALYRHSSLNPDECVRRLLEHYQRRP